MVLDFIEQVSDCSVALPKSLNAVTVQPHTISNPDVECRVVREDQCASFKQRHTLVKKLSGFAQPEALAEDIGCASIQGALHGTERLQLARKHPAPGERDRAYLDWVNF